MSYYNIYLIVFGSSLGVFNLGVKNINNYFEKLKKNTSNNNTKSFLSQLKNVCIDFSNNKIDELQTDFKLKQILISYGYSPADIDIAKNNFENRFNFDQMSIGLDNPPNYPKIKLPTKKEGKKEKMLPFIDLDSILGLPNNNAMTKNIILHEKKNNSCNKNKVQNKQKRIPIEKIGFNDFLFSFPKEKKENKKMFKKLEWNWL